MSVLWYLLDPEDSCEFEATEGTAALLVELRPLPPFDQLLGEPGWLRMLARALVGLQARWGKGGMHAVVAGALCDASVARACAEAGLVALRRGVEAEAD